MRWMLVLEDSDKEVLYLGKGIPRTWLASGQEIKIEQAPTRWGRVNFSLLAKPDSKSVVAKVELSGPGEPKELQVKLRLARESQIQNLTVNGRAVSLGGQHNDTVIFQTEKNKTFEIVGRLS